VTPDRVLILGTGAMACALGARLARSGVDVTLAGTWEAALQRIEAYGVRVEDDKGTWFAPVRTARRTPSLPAARLVLVLVKSTETHAVARTLPYVLEEDSLAVTLQNGLGNLEALETTARGRIGLGVTTLGATLLGPGHVRVLAGRIILGTKPQIGRSMAELAALFKRAGLDAELTRFVDRAVWRKLAVNCAINPLSALNGCTNGGLLKTPEPRGTLIRAAEEVVEVAASGGIDCGAGVSDLVLEVVSRTFQNRSSMLQDLERGARTEIDALSGAVSREARRVGLRVPVNEELWRQVCAREGRPAPTLAASSP